MRCPKAFVGAQGIAPLSPALEISIAPLSPALEISIAPLSPALEMSIIAIYSQVRYIQQIAGL
jgi:hypothetical protein